MARWTAPALALCVLCSLLLGCGGGGGSAASQPPPAVANTAAYEAYVAGHKTPLRSLTDGEDFSDLDAIAPHLAGKRIVQLGESTHGSRQMNQLKTRFIKYLHQRQGFDVVAFESPLLPCSLGRETTPGMRGDTLLRGCTFGVWHTREVVELFNYIVSTQGSERPLQLAGFDVQIIPSQFSVGQVRQYLEPLALRHLGAVPEQLAPMLDELFELDNLAFRSCDVVRQPASCAQVLARYRAPQAFFEDLAAQLDGPDGERMLAALAARSLALTLELQREWATGYRGTAGVRDQGMAQQLGALANGVHAGRKIVVWAHNAHIATDYPNEAMRAAQDKPMGMHLASDWGDELYTIALYMLQGQSMGPDGPIAVTPHARDSLESIAASVGEAQFFLPFSASDAPGPEDDWLHRPTVTKYWGAWEQPLVLARTYDAVFIVRSSGLPDYMP